MISGSRTLIEAIQLAKENGYVEDFRYHNQKIIARSSKNEYAKDACLLASYSLHEGTSSSDDTSILFHIECEDGTKGCLSSAFGRDANTDLMDFVMSLSKK